MTNISVDTYFGLYIKKKIAVLSYWNSYTLYRVYQLYFNTQTRAVEHARINTSFYHLVTFRMHLPLQSTGNIINVDFNYNI